MLSLIIVLIGLIVVSAVAYFLSAGDLFRQKSDDAPISDPEQVPETVYNGSAADVEKAQKTVKEISLDDAGLRPSRSGNKEVASTKSDLARIATSFAERFGTYSNQSNFSNITSLKIFMSKEMKKWADQYISAQKKAAPDSAIYYGMNTKVAATETGDLDEGKGSANILVITRRREAIGTTGNLSDVFTQNIRIDFVKEDGSWKVDKAIWLE